MTKRIKNWISRNADSINRVSMTTCVILILAFTVYFWFTISIAYQQFTEKITGCDGIDRYYSGLGFRKDFLNMSVMYEDCYDSNESIFPNLLEPKDLCVSQGFDCEDFAHSVICLGKEYSLKCSNFVKIKHVGVECLLDDQWETLN